VVGGGGGGGGERAFTVGADDAGRTLAALLRRHGLAVSWSQARRWIATGKVRVGGETVIDPASRPAAGAAVLLRMAAPRVGAEPGGRIVFDDAQVVVLDKPAGVSSVPYEAREGGTAMDLVRAHWRRAGRAATEAALRVVHRIDKETSGLIAFAKTAAAERALQARFRAHDIERTYLCVVHGHLTDRRIESRLIEDRGDGLRGSTTGRFQRGRGASAGKRAVTHVRAIEAVGPDAMLCEVRLETGKTHQIRIHLAENGHPLVGERVYIRDFAHAGREPLPSPRLLLHAATLGFDHPIDGTPLRLESPLPPDFKAVVSSLRGRAAPAPGPSR
jgi:23S rRNA pseudouridine1911/1915/1917 synthase